MESILIFNMTLWYSNLSIVNRAKLSKIVNEASKMQRYLNDLYRRKVKQKSLKIVEDGSHPLHGEIQLLPSGRRHMATTSGKESLPIILCAVNIFKVSDSF